MDARLGSLERSHNSWHRMQVEFENLTGVTVRVVWLDYSGEEVEYTRLAPGDTYDIATFATHPWIFRSTEQPDQLLAAQFPGARKTRFECFRYGHALQRTGRASRAVVAEMLHGRGQVTMSVQIVAAVYPVPALLNIATNSATAQIVSSVVSSDSGGVMNLTTILARRLADIDKLEIPAKLREILEERFMDLIAEEHL